jgi:hypothetical protein
MNDRDRDTGWRPVDILQFLDKAPLRGPSLFTREDNVSLLYPGLVNAFVGEPEGMKSWAWQFCAVQVLERGGRVLVLDFENSARTVLPRMQVLGATREQLMRDFCYIAPSSPLGDPLVTSRLQGYSRRPTRDYCEFFDLVAAGDFALVVIDGVTDAMALHGLDADRSNSDAAIFDRYLLKPIASLGATVLVIDHVPKEKDSRGVYAIGAQHKRAAITGAQYGFTIAKPFGRGCHGVAHLYLQKDKPGDVAPYASKNRRQVADLHLRSVDDRVEASLEPPEASTGTAAGEEWLPLLMEKASLFIEANDGFSKNAICEQVGVNRSSARTALEHLVSDGYVAIEKGRRRSQLHHSVKPYRAQKL